MEIIFGLLAIIGVLLEEYFAAAYTKYTIMGFSLLFLPFGALFVGGIVGAAMSKGLHLSNKKLNIKRALLCALFGAVTFVAINFMEYKTTYVVKDKISGYTTNRTFKGEPIGEISFGEGQEKITFIDFIKEDLDFGEKTYRLKGGREISVDSSGTLNYILFFASFLVMVLGAAGGSAYFTVGDYCEACKKYHANKEIFYSNDNDINLIFEDYNKLINDDIQISKFVQEHKKRVKGKVIYKGKLSYCKECMNAKIIINKEIKQANKMVEVKSAERIINIEKSLLQLLI